jgi:uncharacterized protein
MSERPSRRDFLAAGIGLPAVALASPAGVQRTPAPPAPGQLVYRELGKTGLKPTRVSFGCMITSDPSVIERAVDLGINYFDTSRRYQNGNNERMLGAAVGARRKSVMISTKTGATTREDALRDIDTSLKELGTDYVDVWELHGRNSPADLTDDLLEAQATAKKAGKCRFVGVSTHAGQPELIPAIIRKMPHFDMVQTSYNFTMDPAIDALIESAAGAGVGVVAMKVMAGGFRSLKPGQKGYDTLRHDGAMLAALKWALRNPHVTNAIPSITDMEQLDENVRAMSSPFSESDQKTLAAQLDYIRPLYCRMCGNCTGKCPQGVPVADVLRFLSYAEGYGEFQLARESFLTLPAGVRDVRCDACETCAVRCPNGVRVSDRLKRAQELLA